MGGPAPAEVPDDATLRAIRQAARTRGKATALALQAAVSRFGRHLPDDILARVARFPDYAVERPVHETRKRFTGRDLYGEEQYDYDQVQIGTRRETIDCAHLRLRAQDILREPRRARVRFLAALLAAAPVLNVVLVVLLALRNNTADGGFVCMLVIVYFFGVPLVLLGVASVWQMESLSGSIWACGILLLLPPWVPSLPLALIALFMLHRPWTRLAFPDGLTK